ncbi:unnamed protein product [Cyclocybe aegerita]|uniref:Uncharacterized protein n=1 Tax=Cyclocybe aegerita TaxID=1973307 RepID=A0A8S0XMG7_CYCAE|nr:unnamed protein product [Cyclocybe aegerita]
MPKTRNVTRSQRGAANPSQSTRRNNAENIVGHESEKENAGQANRGQTRTHRRPTLGGTTTTTTSVSRGPGGKTATRPKVPPKGKPTAQLKEKKLPLQDITSQFLPATEAMNRGESHHTVDDEPQDVGEPTIAALPPASEVAVPAPPAFASPLPPSSPPSELSSPFYTRQEIAATLSAVLFSPTKPESRVAHDPWQELDDARPASRRHTPGSSGSDPFGFVALERKLKKDRKAVAPHDDAPADDDDDLGEVLVADTSSPRPVRRLKRVHDDEPLPEVEEGGSDDAEPVVSHPHFPIPDTPHKDKQKRRRLSHEGHDVFSPCSSSIQSSPSPTKASARKVPRPTPHEDPLEEFNEEVERSFAEEAVPAASDDAIAKHLRPRAKPSAAALTNDGEQEHADRKKTKSSNKAKTPAKKPASKSRRAPAKKQEKAVEEDGEDVEEKWERERQERVEYFKRLDDYKVEKEDVYII